METRKKPTEVGKDIAEGKATFSPAKIGKIFERVEADSEKMKEELLSEGERWKANILDLEKPIKETEYLFTIAGQKTIPAGELVAIKGKAKQGKSQLEYLLISAILGATMKDVKANRGDLKAFLFDTEQSEGTLKKCVQRALKTAGKDPEKNHPQFTPLFLRPLTVDERKKVIEDAVSAESPQIVFIDGIRDLMADFNDLTESGKLIAWLLRLCADFSCTIISVLHQNKAKEDGNMRGHLGTELLNKLSDCYEVTKKDGRFLVSCTDSRNLPAPDFAFSLGADEKYHDEAAPRDTAREGKIEKIRKTLDECFSDEKSLTHNDLMRLFAENSMLSERSAKRYLREAKEYGLLTLSSGKYQMGKGG